MPCSECGHGNHLHDNGRGPCQVGIRSTDPCGCQAYNGEMTITLDTIDWTKVACVGCSVAAAYHHPFNPSMLVRPDEHGRPSISYFLSVACLQSWVNNRVGERDAWGGPPAFA